MATFQIETPHGTLEIEHDGDASSLTPAVNEWVQGKSNLKLADEYLAASTAAPKESLSEFITPASGTGPTDVSKGFDIGGALEESPMTAGKFAGSFLEQFMTAGGDFGTGLEMIPSAIEPKSYEPGYEPGITERAVNIGQTIGAGLVGYALSPAGIALPAIGYAAPTAGTAIGVGFAAKGAKDIPDHFRAIIDSDTTQEKDAAIAATVMDAAMILGGGGITSVGGRRSMSKEQRESFSLAREAISKADTKYLQAAVADPKIVENIGPDAKEVVVAELQRRAIAKQQQSAVERSTLAAEQQARNLAESYSPATAAAVIEINRNENITQSSSRPPNAPETDGQPAVQAGVSERTLDPDTGTGNQQRSSGALPETGASAERDVTAGLERKPISPAPEPVTPEPAAVPADTAPPPAAKVAGEPLPEPTRTEPSPVATPAAAVPEVAAPAAKAGEGAEPTQQQYDAMVAADRVKNLRRLKEERKDLIAKYGNQGEKHPLGRMIGGLNPAAVKLQSIRGQIAQLERLIGGTKPEKPVMTPISGTNAKREMGLLYNVKFGERTGKIGKSNLGKWYAVENGEIVTQDYRTAAEARDAWAKLAKPTPAAPAAPKPAPVVPKLREGQRQGDLLGGSEDLTLVGERVKSEPAKPVKPQATVQETINEALDAYGDLPSAWEHLDNQQKTLESDTRNKAVVDRLKAAKRKIENVMEDEARREEMSALETEQSNGYELLSSVKQLGGLPTLGEKGRYATGELKRIAEASKGAFLRFFRKGAKSLDRLRESLNERGFAFETPEQMLMAIEDSLATGKKQYGSQFPEGYTGGPGAMGPVEKAYQEASRKIFQSAQEPIQQRRVAEQRGDREEWLRRSDPDRMAEAEAIMENDARAGRKLVDSINAGETKSATDIQELILVRELIDLHAQRDLAAERLADPDPTITRTEREQYQKDWNEANERIGLTEDASDKTGSEKGAAFRMRRMMVADDYSLQGLSRRERKMKGRDLTPEEVEALRKESDAVKKKQEELDLAAEKESKEELENAVDSVLAAAIADREAQKSAAQRSGDLPYHPSILARAEEIVKGIEAKRDELRAKVDWRKLFGSQSGAVGGVGGGKGEGKPMGGKSRAQETREARAAAVEYLAYEIAAHISRFGVNRAKTLEVMLTKFDESIRPFYGKAWDAAQKIVGGKTKSEKPKVAKAVKTGATAPEKQPKPPKPPKSKDTLVGEGRAAIEATGKLSHNVVAQIVDGMIDAGNRDRADIFKRTTKIVQEFMPEAEMRDVYRAYVDYGKKTYPNPDEAAAFKRKTRQAVKIEEDIARLKEKMRPELQGYQREKMDLELRDLVKRRSELLKDPSLPQEPGAFASKDEAKQTRIKNRIEELDRYLKTGEKPVEGKPTQPDSAATEQLRAEKEALEAYVREVDAAKNPPPPEHVAELARLQDRADILRDRLARMELTQPKAEGKPTVDTAEIAAAKAEIKQLSETIAELRKPIPLSDAQKALDSALVARERAGQTLDDLSTGKVKDPVKIKEALTQLEEDVRLETDALKALAAEMRRDAKPKGDPGYLKEQAQIKALERAIASYADKVAKGDLAGKGKVMGPDSRRVAQLKAIRDSRRAAYKAAKDAGKPVRSPEDRYNDTRLNAMKRREADLKARAARQAAGDFSKKPKPVTPALRRDVLNKKAELQKMKDKIDLRQKEHELSQQPAWQKALRGLGEARGIVLGGDLGVLTRQGAFSWSHPINSTIGAIKATQAMFSPEAMGRWEVEMRERVIDGKPVAPIRKEAGLQTTDTMSHPEELVITRLLSRMPDIKVGGRTIKASVFFKGLERFQTTFINDVRMRTFDAAVKRGFTPEELKLLANFINSATGRSNAKMVGPWLSAIFTSPRYERSRWEMLAQPVRNIGALARSGVKGELNRAALANLKDMAATAAGAYVLFQLAASAGGYTVNWDPTSSDFLKMRKGDEVWDVSAGLAPRIRDLMRLWVGANHPDYNENWMKTGAKMFVRTINPALKTPAEQFFIAKQRWDGEDDPRSPFTGFKSDEEREGLITLAPLIIQSMREAMKEDGVGAAVWAGAREFVGSSVSRYPEPKN